MLKTQITLAGILLVLAAGCTQKPLAGADDTLGPGEVATVNGQRIPESLFRFYTMSALKKDPDKLTPEERKAVIDDLIGFELLADQATATMRATSTAWETSAILHIGPSEGNI